RSAPPQPDTDPYDLAGVWVDMNLSWGVAGTLGTREAGETDGNVLTYRLVDDEWVPGPIVRPPVPTQDTFFAATAVLDGDFLYVGAPNDNENGELAGAVYVFREDAGEWVFEQKILGPRANALFGATLDVDGDVLAGGAICSGCFFDTSLAYSAFAFERVDGRWEFAGELQPQGGSTPFMRFGTGITVDGDRIVVGARFAGDGAGGAAFEFRRTDQWRPRSVIVSPVQDRGQDFGIGMSVDGDELLVGAPQISGGIGLPGARVFAFEFCTADFDNDGELTIFDFLEFQTRFADMDLAADLDGDGVLTIFDFLAFQTAFDDGCP
ncbi:MAG: GC-type dockerin domain-anchored protein, partial [Phycisphaerales bacterium]